MPASSRNTPEERLSIPGLGAPVEIAVDRWGVPHIRADSLSDLFFAQGFNAARDRLWQIDLARKRGLGLLAADFGPGFLAQDRAARLFLYRGDMAAEWAAYGSDARDICTSFANGINAYIDLTAREPDRLPLEFRQLATHPERWRPEDVVRVRTHAWMRNALSEVTRANVMARSNAESDLLRANLEPPITPKAQPGIDLTTIPMDVTDVYRLATTPVTFSQDRLGARIEQAETWRKISALGEVVPDPGSQGSNNWTIAGERTETGRPILANDPHRLHAVPSLRYLVHLTAPGFDAIGTGEAIFPGIMIGHNGHAAFGLTLFFGPDEEDVYVYETDPQNPNRYRYKDDWEEMALVEEVFSIKGAPDQRLTLKFTRHGPVIHEDEEGRRAFAVRTVWSEPGTTAYGASLISMRARSFDAFRAAMRKWGVPAVNQVYADQGGTVGWITAGFSPVRENWDGLLPVPGDGRFEWAGFVDADDMPWVCNPKKGFFATANEMNVPSDWLNLKRPIGYEWWEPSRAVRLHEVLGGQTKHSVADSCALQTDIFSVPAKRLTAVVDGLRGADGDAMAARAMLKDWDFRLAADSAPAALFELWWSKHLKPALVARLIRDPSLHALIVPGDVEAILRAIEKPDSRFGVEPRVARDMMLVETLAAAYRDCAERLGSDPGTWRWGRLHHGFFEHAVSAVRPDAGDPSFDVGPLPKGGGESTPMMATYRPLDFRVTLGASVRIVIDVGDWDKSLWINAPGQSGDPRSPHYADLAPLWARGDYVPMLYSRDAIEPVVETRIQLRPRP